MIFAYLEVGVYFFQEFLNFNYVKFKAHLILYLSNSEKILPLESYLSRVGICWWQSEENCLQTTWECTKCKNIVSQKQQRTLFAEKIEIWNLRRTRFISKCAWFLVFIFKQWFQKFKQNAFTHSMNVVYFRSELLSLILTKSTRLKETLACFQTEQKRFRSIIFRKSFLKSSE